MKSVTRKALFTSLIFHLFFLITTFYVVVQNQLITSDKAGLTAEFLVAENTDQPKKPPLKKIAPRLHIPSHELVDVSTEESPLSLVSPIAVKTETPRLALGRSVQAEVETEKPSAALDLSEKNWEDVSTATRALRDVAGNLSKTEAASPAGQTTYGAKRPGPPKLQRAPQGPNLKMVKEREDISAAFTDEILEKQQAPVSFPTLMKRLAEQIAETSEGAPIDVVFVIDASGSMENNIKSVIEHLKEMIDIYEASQIDYALGVTEFWASREGNEIKVTQLTKSYVACRRTLQAIGVHSDENALDAIVQTVKELQFRATSKRHFILITDEPFTSREGLRLEDAIAHCREFGIYVNVLGIPLDEHFQLASETGGKWHAIPQEPGLHNAQMSARSKTVSLQQAQWADITTKISSDVLQHGSNAPVDIILFVDNSKSMADILPHFSQQLDTLVRDCDNALIDYQMGVVRFRAVASENTITVYNPPQTLEQIRKIAEFSCQDDENLLDAVVDGLQRLKLRPNAHPYFILVTDEPTEGKHSPRAIIQMLQQKQIRVSVIGTNDDFQQQVTTATGGVWVPIPEGQRINSSYW